MKKRLKKDKISPMALTDRDKAIVLSVYENRFLRRDQIQRLYFLGASLPACNMRLKKLYEHKFLDRLFKPVAVGSAQAVYALDKRGADIVAVAHGVDRHQVNWKRDHNRVEFLFMEHTLAVSEFKVNLDLALTQNKSIDPALNNANCGTSLSFYQRGNKIFQIKVADPSGKKKYLVVAPDAFFGLKTDKGNSYFFVEVDMGTETLSRFAGKIVAYKQFWKWGKYTEKYGFKNFRVLTIAESEKRLVNLIDATAKVGGKNMFLFTTFAGIEKSILGEAWLSTVLDEAFSLLE